MNAHSRIHAVTASLEGGFLSAADASTLGDPGGATKCGISQRLLDSLGVTRDSVGAPHSVDAVTPTIAERIGRALFWEPVRASELYDESPALALALYDCAFQSGPDRAVRIIQRALDVKADGAMGPKTLAAASSCLSPLLVALDAIAERREWLSRWAAADPKRSALMRGLHRRCDAIAHAAVEIESECRGWDLRAPLTPVA
jgi:lysozyme family protein